MLSQAECSEERAWAPDSVDFADFVRDVYPALLADFLSDDFFGENLGDDADAWLFSRHIYEGWERMRQVGHDVVPLFWYVVFFE